MCCEEHAAAFRAPQVRMAFVYQGDPVFSLRNSQSMRSLAELVQLSLKPGGVFF